MINPKTILEKQTLRMALIKRLSNIPNNQLKRIQPDQMIDVLPMIDWILKPHSIVKNPFPSFSIRFKKYVGPVGRLETTSMSEFISADDAFLSFHNAKNMESAWLLLAILWRPIRKDLTEFRKSEDWNNDLRVPFNSSSAKILSKKYQKRLHISYAAAALFYYENVRHFSLVNNPLLSSLFSSTGKPSNLGWLQTLLASSGGKFGNFKETSETNWLLLLVSIDQEMKQKNA